MIAVLKGWFVELPDIPAVQQEDAAIPDGLFFVDSHGSKFFLVGWPVMSLNIFFRFVNAVDIDGDGLRTEEDFQRADEVDIDFSQGRSSSLPPYPIPLPAGRSEGEGASCIRSHR